jgi:hypothetical protein
MEKIVLQHDPAYLIGVLDLKIPLIGLYDAPGGLDFNPVITSPAGMGSCIFESYQDWINGTTLQLTKENYGCGGCGRAFWSIQTRSRANFIDFLANKEGLKASADLMEQWIDLTHTYKPRHENIFIGPLRAEHYPYLKSITFFVNPDQLSVLLTGAQYHHQIGEPMPVLASFGSGCMEMLTHFDDLNKPQAIIGATDIAMRDNLPQGILALTVTKPLFERLCSLDKTSFLGKPFLKNLKKARGGVIG